MTYIYIYMINWLIISKHTERFSGGTLHVYCACCVPNLGAAEQMNDHPIMNVHHGDVGPHHPRNEQIKNISSVTHIKLSQSD